MSDLELYISKYCKQHEIDPNRAFEYAAVRNYAEYLEEAKNGKNNASEWYAGCGCVVAEDKSC